MTLPAIEAGALAALAAQDADNTRIAAIAKALGHPARVRIVKLLLAKRACIGCDIVEDAGLAQSTVSEHLRILKAAGIITGEIERPRICYSLNRESLAPLADFLDALAVADEPAPAPLANTARRTGLDSR